MEIATSLRTVLAEKVGRQRYDLWFGQGTKLAMEEDRLIVGVPNRFFQDFLRTNFRGEIESACRDVMGRCPSLEFRIDAAAPETIATLHIDVGPAERKDRARHAAQASHEKGAAAGDGRSDAAPQRRKFSNLDSFVTGRTNRLARAAAQMIVERPGTLSPLFVHGPTSVGKTHLLEGIWTAFRKTRPTQTAIYLTAEQFTTGFLQALRGSGLPSFRQKYRGVGLLLIDDIQFLCGKRYTQVELLHTIDTFLREGRQMAFTADRPPDQLSEFGPELCTRLQGGMVCRIESPDYETRLGIITHMALRLSLDIPQNVKQFIASHLTNHARELSGALCRLQACSQAAGVPIGLAMAEEALADIISHSSRVIRLPDIEKAVCKAFGLDPSSLQSDRKAKRVSHPRMLAMWLARKYTRAALAEIGQYFGRRSHATVISAQKRVQDWLSAGTPVELADREWEVDEAIRQVERHLLAG